MFDAPPPNSSTTTCVALQQSPGFERALRHLGQSPLRLASGDLVLRQKFGPLHVHMLTRSQSIELPKNFGGAVLIAPDRPFPDLTALPLVSPATVAEIDLTPDIKTLHSALKGKWRNRLRHAQSHELRVSRQNMPVTPDHWLLQAETAQQQRLKYRHWPAAFTSAFATENKGDAKLFEARYGSDIIAGMLIFRHGNTATYHIGHTSTAGRILSAQTLLMWSAVTWAKSKGIKRLDLGVIDTNASPGLARFKLGTGAQTRKLGGTWLWHRALRPILPIRHIDRHLMR